MKKKLKATGYLPPSVMFYMFNTLIQPILLYDSEISGVRKTGCSAIDTVFVSFMKHNLYIKQSTSNIITTGECGQIRPSVVCHTNVINPLCATFLRENISIYLHFMLFLHTNKTQVVEIPPRVRQGPAYST